MTDVDDRLHEARCRLAYAVAELSRFWHNQAENTIDGWQLARLERDVERARDDVRTLEARLDVNFGGVDA